MIKLDDLIAGYLKRSSNVISEFEDKVENPEDVVPALHNMMKQTIVNEIKLSCIDELKEEAKKQLVREQKLKRIEEIRALIFDGFILAFIIGISVNLLTKIYDAFDPSIWVTVVLVAAFLCGCMIFYSCKLVSQIKMLISSMDDSN